MGLSMIWLSDLLVMGPKARIWIHHRLQAQGLPTAPMGRGESEP